MPRNDALGLETRSDGTNNKLVLRRGKPWGIVGTYQAKACLSFDK
jgi:hypothetical protein